MTLFSGVMNFTTRYFIYFLILFYVLFIAFNCNCVSAIRYNIWFKYPQPYNPSEPVTFCKENTTSTTQNCTWQIPIFANTLDSERTFIPYSHNQFDFCPSVEGFEYHESDLLEWDDKIFRTSYDIRFLREERCKLLCKRGYDLSRIYDIHRISVLKMLMAKDYYQHWFGDNFPVSWCYNQSPQECFIGVPIGYYVDEHGNPNDPRVKKRGDLKPDTFYLFNHIDFTFTYESGTGKEWGDNLGDKIGKITGIKVRPRSIKHEKTNFKNCAIDSPLLEIPSSINYSSSFAVYYSYSISFIKDESITAHQRWNRLLDSLPESSTGKWYIATSILLVILISIPFTYVLSRTILTKQELFGWINSKPLSNPNCGWQSVANDVFRPPNYPMIFSSLIGSGIQYILCLLLVEILTILVHFATSMVLIALVVIFLLLLVGSIGGYISTRFYKSFNGEKWKQNCLLTAALNPIMLTATLFLTRNFLLLESASAIAYPIGLTPAIFLLLISYGISLPLTFAGAYFGYNHQSVIQYPVKPTANAREIPQQPIYSYFPVGIAIGGLIPFISVWIVENYPFFTSGEFMVTTCAILLVIESGVIFCYLHLSTEDYRWWWRSYLTTGFASAYYLIHTITYVSSTIIIEDFLSALLYGIFCVILSTLLFSLIGTLGFIACLTFVYLTYTMNKPSAEIDYATFPEGT